MDGTIGEYLYKGINESKGDIISFLDDDDLFFNNKLEIIIKYFNNGYDYVHNKAEIMGNKMDNVYGGIAFNMSSISIKKDFINIDHLKNNVFTNQDTFMYYSCLENHGQAIDIKDVLTVYRINNSVTNAVTKSFDDYESKRLKKAMLFNDSYLIFISIFKNKHVVHDIKSNIFLNDLTIFSRKKYKRPRYFIYFLLYKKYWNKRFAIFEYFSLLLFGNIARSVLTNKRKKRFFNYISKYEANGEF